jgi:hypothetical protein
LSRPAFQYAAVDGPPNTDDPLLAEFGTLVYDGLPPTIYPKTTPVWRIYKIKNPR